MNTVLLIASDEWRYWRRSKLGAAAGLLALILSCASLLATMNQVRSERETRVALQHEAEHTFRDQPARHPTGWYITDTMFLDHPPHSRY